MDNRLTYEILLTEKLESRPIPDLADAIWSRIEAQLDIELPPGTDTPAPAALEKIAGKWWKGFGLSAFVVALTLAFFQERKQTSSSPYIRPAGTDSFSVAPQKIDRTPSPNVKLEPSRRAIPNPVKPFKNFKATSSSVAPPLPANTNRQVDIEPGKLVEPLVRPLPVKTDTVKTTRGVKGITDDDYRIEPAG